MSKPRFQVQTRHLLFVLFAVGMLCATWVTIRSLYYAERRQVVASLSDIEGIEFITIDSFEDITEEVFGIKIRVKEIPGSEIRLTRIDASDGSFSLTGIGDWNIAVYGHRQMGAYSTKTGKQVKSFYYGYAIDLGPRSPYSKLIPFESGTLQGVVDHYAEFEKVLSKWPREANPGQVVLEDGSTQYFFVANIAENDHP